jgi:AbrB family looped-hinge helix DNA binding protein
MFRATVTSKGQITLPKPVRDALGLSKSTVVVFEVRDGEAVMRPLGRGFLDLFATVPPHSRPEDWQKIREQTMEEVAREIVGEMA